MGTWIMGAIILTILALAARKIYKDRKNGKGCGYGCDGCSKCPNSDGHKSA